jgi:hypothetical protein
MNRRISHSASNFQAVLVNHRLWHADCLFRGGWHFPGERNSQPASVNVKRTPDQETGRRQECTMKPQSILDWYRVLRLQHQWTIFQAVRYALWLAR